MHYTKIALLIFGLGMIAGLVVVAGEYQAWERAAAAVMALGLALIPLGLFADGHGMVPMRWLAGRLRRRPAAKPRSKPRATAPRRRPPARGARPAARTGGAKRRR
jgi:hypothetical protein